MIKKLLTVLVLTLALLSVPAVATAHSKSGTLTGKYIKNVERWRPLVAKHLKSHGVYSKRNEGLMLNVIKHESHGDPKARNGDHRGLLQQTSGWGSVARRLDPDRAIHMMVHSYVKGGIGAWERHWRATLYR